MLRVNAYRIEGATLVPHAQLQDALKGFTGRDLSFTQLQEAAWVLVQTYRHAGWVAHAVVPQQEIKGGIVTLRVIEARLGQALISYAPDTTLPRALIQAMTDDHLTPGHPLNLRQVERLLLVLDDMPGVMANATFAEGQEDGSTDVLISLGADKAVEGNLGIDNFGSRSTGLSRASASLSVNNPAGMGDALQLLGVITQGSHYARLAYSLPIGLQGWRAGLQATDMRYHLVGSFAALQAQGLAQSWGAYINAPLVRQAQHNLNWQTTIDRKRLNNLALASNTATELSTISGYKLDVLRSSLTGNWLDQALSHAQNTLSIQSSWGRVDLADSPNAGNDASAANIAGWFHKINLNFNREQSLTNEASWYLQAGGQWANRNLDSAEKLYLGGVSGVRAYPSNEAGGSLGSTATTGVKLRVNSATTLNAFVDWGRIHVYRYNQGASANELTNLNVQSLQGHGLTLSWRSRQGHDISATWSRRQGVNPAANPTTGADSDGTLKVHRLWISASLNF